MDQVWSWDHCFNAVALAEGQPDAAWDQMEVMFAHQDEHGAFPDGLNDMIKHYNFEAACAWLGSTRVDQAQPSCCNPGARRARLPLPTCWQAWWLRERRQGDEPLAHYLHGNDSGWDNSTMFDTGVPLVAPDLTALLVVPQARTLADLADHLGFANEAAEYRTQGESLLGKLLELWDGERFIPQRLEADGTRVPVTCQSLVPLVASFLGTRLPANVGSVPHQPGALRHRQWPSDRKPSQRSVHRRRLLARTNLGAIDNLSNAWHAHHRTSAGATHRK